MKTTFVSLFLLVIIVLNSCKQDDSILEPSDYIDPNLVGDWYVFLNWGIHGEPDYHLHGIKIYEDGSISTLGINLSTGQLTCISPKCTPFQKILYASNGTMQIERQLNGLIVGEEIYLQKYQLTDSTLTYVYGDGDNITYGVPYTKSVLGEKIVEPVTSEFSVKVDQDMFTNSKIWYCPSAYAGSGYSFTSDSTVFEIYATSAITHSIRIQIDNFNGAGQYTLGTGNDGMGVYETVGYETVGGCDIGLQFTDQINSGFVRIDEYDTDNNICTGVFEFYVGDHELTFTEGIFTLPIYN